VHSDMLVAFGSGGDQFPHVNRQLGKAIRSWQWMLGLQMVYLSISLPSPPIFPAQHLTLRDSKTRYLE
jgi:hypothetical protein